MAKKLNNISKSQRINAIKDVLNRWGAIEKDKIDHHVAIKLGVEKETIKKSIYRDLDQLTDDRILEKEYFTRDGILIDNFDPDTHKNFMCKWSLFDSNYQIIGQKIIEDYGGKIFCPKLFSSEVSISENDTGISLKSRHLFFILGDRFVKIAIHKDALPIKVLIVRNDNKFTPEFKQSIEQALGRRVLILMIPDASISRFKGGDQVGHCLIELGMAEDKIIDFKSTNKTYFYKVSKSEIDELLKIGRSMSHITLDTNWNSEFKKSAIEESVHGVIELEPSYFLRAGREFSFLFI